mgnify:CR=1 FL=1
MLKEFFKKLENNETKLNKLLPIFIIFIFIILNITIVFKIYLKENQNKNFFRLHVVANSDSIEDQITKLKVYQKVSDYINSYSDSNIENSEQLKDFLKNNSDNILKISDSTLKENNKSYLTTLEIGKVYYDEKQSVLLDMDNGIYDSVKIVLGNGEGKNIWTLICPNSQNLQKVKNLNTILPGIEQIYNINNECDIKDCNNETKDLIYDFKILELIKNIQNNI